MSKEDKTVKVKRVPAGGKESKHTKFARIVVPRVNKALKAIKLIGNCSSKDYAYSHEDVIAITTALEKAIENLDKRFTGAGMVDNSFNL